MRSPAPIVLVAFLAACGGPEIYFENDVLAPNAEPSDRNYTNGIRVQYTAPADESPAWARPLINALNPFRWDRATEIGLTAGQQIFTPRDLSRSEVIPDDRPYAGWLFGGIARYDCEYDDSDARRRDSQVMTEYVLGVLGPPALGEETQRLAHKIFQGEDPQGWANQVATEPTFMMSLQRQDRLWARQARSVGVDFLTRVGASVGTPVTNGFVGGMLRTGWRLPRDFAATPSNPSLSYSALARRSETPYSVHVFGGAVVRGVAYSSFLDGTLFRSSPHTVAREPWVADLEAGIAVQIGWFRVGYTVVERTPEFRERRENHRFGSLHVSWTLRR
ncbi:MAG: lipid A deacylase LpxR family protein [Planctomycetota bacterium]